MIVKTVKLADLTEDEYRRCHSLNARHYGDMQDALRWRYHKKDNATIHMITGEGGILIAWALVFKSKFSKSRYPVAHFYVRKIYRNKGYGKILMNEALNHNNKLRVFPHNDTSARFFSNYRKHISVPSEMRRRLEDAFKHSS